LDCPRCSAKPGEAGDMSDDVVELMDFERIEADVMLDALARIN
jgi:hypothetical protein